MTNRRIERRRLFFEDADYQAFLQLLADGKKSCAVKLHGFCLMPNHVHAVVQPQENGALSEYLKRVLGRYARDLRSATRTVGHGHVFQGRFWSDVIEHERHFLRVLRYVETNPLRAQLVKSADEWPWSSLQARQRAADLLDPLPVVLPREWAALVNAPQPAEDLEAIRSPRARGRPVAATAPHRPAAQPTQKRRG